MKAIRLHLIYSKFLNNLGYKIYAIPKSHTFPTLFDEVLQLSITKPKEWSYLKRNQIRTGAISQSRSGYEIGSISIQVYTNVSTPVIHLDYKYRDKLSNYKVYLVSVPSNLGKAEILYFQCSNTKKRCRKLYSIGGYFFHREAFIDCMYQSQTYSKHYRQLDKTLG